MSDLSSKLLQKLLIKLAAILQIVLQDMKRPFKPMKDLDMEKVISDIIDKIKWRDHVCIELEVCSDC